MGKGARLGTVPRTRGRALLPHQEPATCHGRTKGDVRGPRRLPKHRLTTSGCTLLALHWDDVDLDKSMLQVRGTLRRTREGLTFGTPKTAASRRKVVLSPTSMAALRRHQVRQDEERRTAGDLWQDLGLVFPNTVGRPMEPRDLLSDVYRPLLKGAGLPPVTFHALPTRPRRCCWQRANIPRWSKSCLDMHRSASHWTATAT